MTLEQNITAILETYFCGFRSELIEACAKRIMEQIERQADTPQTDCETCKHYGTVSVSCDRCDKSTHSKYEPQTDCEWKEDK